MERFRKNAGLIALGLVVVSLLLGVASNTFPGSMGKTISGPAFGSYEPTQHDTNELADVSRAIIWQADGTITYKTVNGDIADLTMTAGSQVNVQAVQIYDTGTDLTDAQIEVLY